LVVLFQHIENQGFILIKERVFINNNAITY
jgi:hypothetical protein